MCYRTLEDVTKYDPYGNEIYLTRQLQDPPISAKPLFYRDSLKLAQVLLYLLYKNNNKHKQSTIIKIRRIDSRTIKTRRRRRS